jgi:hypothetical protein
MSEALRFLLERNAVGTIRGIFGERPASVLQGFDPEVYGQVDSVAAAVMRSAGLQYSTRHDYHPADYFAVDRPVGGRAISVRGYDFAVPLAGHDSMRVIAGGDTLWVVSDLAAMRIRLLDAAADSLPAFELGPMVDTLFALEPAARSRIPLELAVEGARVRALLALSSLSAERRDGVVKVTAWRGDLYLRFVD